MGLASKLAGSQGGPGAPPPGGGYGQQQPTPGGQQARPGGYPGQNQYQPYPGSGAPSSQGSYPGQHGPPPGQGAYPPHQGGYPPQQQGGPPQQGYGGAPPPSGPPNPAMIESFKRSLHETIQQKGIQSFYPPNSPAINDLVNRAPMQIDQVCQRWNVPQEIGNDIVKLGLYDIVLYIDDSGSMAFEENGERIKDLRIILERTAFAATRFDSDGISVRFMNSDPPMNLLNNINDERRANALVDSVQFKGLTPMGTGLRNKVLEPMVIGPARAHQLKKPVLVIVITDGQPAGEPQDAVMQAIRYASTELGRMPQYGPGAIAFQFAQVGNDQKAREFLDKLDNDPQVGSLVDCTSNYENESDQMRRANPPVDLSVDMWLVKLLLGAIDPSYDTQDEQGQSGPPRPPPGAPPGGYGGPPPGQGYPPQQSGYGQPPGGYNRPPPPNPGYPGPGGPGGYPPQQSGYPTPPGGYPPPGGGYGAPPPPPRY